jgi:hypothetical protein
MSTSTKNPGEGKDIVKQPTADATKKGTALHKENETDQHQEANHTDKANTKKTETAHKSGTATK